MLFEKCNNVDNEKKAVETWIGKKTTYHTQHNIIVNYYTLTRSESAYNMRWSNIFYCVYSVNKRMLYMYICIYCAKQQIQETSQRSRNCFIFSLYCTPPIRYYFI